MANKIDKLIHACKASGGSLDVIGDGENQSIKCVGVKDKEKLKKLLED